MWGRKGDVAVPAKLYYHVSDLGVTCKDGDPEGRADGRCISFLLLP